MKNKKNKKNKKYKIGTRVEFIIHYVLKDEFYTGTIENYNHEGDYIIIPDDYEDFDLNETEIVKEDDIMWVIE